MVESINKFRSVINGEVVYWDFSKLVAGCDLNVYIQGYEFRGFDIGVLDFDRSVGLEDKNKKLIFERDVLLLHTTKKGKPLKITVEVIWHELESCFEFRTGNGELSPRFLSFGDFTDKNTLLKYEVIGSTHKDRKLLENNNGF